MDLLFIYHKLYLVISLIVQKSEIEISGSKSKRDRILIMISIYGFDEAIIIFKESNLQTLLYYYSFVPQCLPKYLIWSGNVSSIHANE